MSKKVPFVNSSLCHGLLALCFAVGLGCSSDSSGTGTGGSSGASASSTGSGGSLARGGSSNVAGSSGGGGSSSESAGASGGSTSNKAGTTATGGKSTAAGGSTSVDTSTSTGGKGGTATGGTNATGGSATTGGKTGGTTSLGGAGGTSKTGGTAAGGTGGSTSTGATGGAKPSDGCGKDPTTLKSATVGQASPVNTISGSRQFLVRWPSNYDKTKPYPLHFGLHGANGNLSENGKDNFGLWSLSKDGMIFVTLAGVANSNPNQLFWDGPRDLQYADAVLKQVESELCIDTSRVFLEGFSQGAAMSWYLTGSRPGVFRAVVGHSGGGVGGIPTLSPVAYLGSLGTGEGGGQNTQTDQFAKANGCTIDTLPRAEAGKHVCTPYKGCREGFPVTWCSYDGGHGFTDMDSGSSKSWVPQAVWDFLSPLL